MPKRPSPEAREQDRFHSVDFSSCMDTSQNKHCPLNVSSLLLHEHKTTNFMMETARVILMDVVVFGLIVNYRFEVILSRWKQLLRLSS